MPGNTRGTDGDHRAARSVVNGSGQPTRRGRSAAAVRPSAPAETVVIGERTMALADVVTVASGAPVTLAPAARDRVETARSLVERLVAEDRTVYGVTTGFGHLSRVKIPPSDIATLQRNLIRSHASGVGEPFDIPTTRAVMLLLLNSLSRGHSGVRLATLDLLASMLNAGVTPVVPMRGSVGASGDLAPLAHLSLVLIGEGEAWYAGERLSGGEALRRAGIAPITLGAKEGLALINGTHVMEACGALWRIVRVG